MSNVRNEQENRSIALAHEEFEDHRKDLLEWNFKKSKERREWHDREEIEYKPNAKTFYFVISRDGTIIDGDETHPEVRSDLLEKLKNWYPEENEVRKLTVEIEDEGKLDILLSGKSVYEHGQYLGTIYAGTNISEETTIIRTLLFILIILTIIFSIASAVLGYWMAGRAMVPISNAFRKQKEFTADASHELRTPLSIMQSSLEVIEAEDRQNLSPFSVTVFDDLKDEVKRMSHLVNDLLVLARSDLDKQEIKKQWFSLTNVFEKLQRKFQYESEKQNIQLAVTIPTELDAYGDEEKITQLLFILVDNAIKYNVPNGTVTVSAQVANNQLRIDVADTGVGIPADHQKRIFDRFYRVDQARSRDQGSSGIGLSIADWIVKVHKGKLVVTSEEGKGSTFSIFLPIPK